MALPSFSRALSTVNIQRSHLFVGYLDKHLERVTPPLDKSEPIAVTCSVGYRAGLAARILPRHGCTRVSSLPGGMTPWNKLDLSMDEGADRRATTLDIEGERS